jgi:hypothetical protein
LVFAPLAHRVVRSGEIKEQAVALVRGALGHFIPSGRSFSGTGSTKKVPRTPWIIVIFGFTNVVFNKDVVYTSEVIPCTDKLVLCTTLTKISTKVKSFLNWNTVPVPIA